MAVEDKNVVSSYFWGPLVNGIIRLIIGCYALAITITYIIQDFKNVATPLGYFTFLSNFVFLFLAIFFLWAGAMSINAYFSGKSLLSSGGAFIMHCYGLQHTAALVYSPLVTVAYWVALHNHELPIGKDGSHFEYNVFRQINIFMLGCAFTFVEWLLLSSMPPPSDLYLIPLIVFDALYVAYLYLMVEGLKLRDTTYWYSFMDKDKAGYIALVIVAFFAATGASFYVVKFSVRFKNWIYEDKLGRSIVE